MAGEGSMMGAIISLRNNKALLSNGKRANWKDYVGTKDVPTEDHIKPSPELLAKIRNHMQAENKRKKKQQIFFVFLSFVFALSVVYGISRL
uniref:hypothetical protein n=1 Tax=Flavobacterium sp. TaxID=239 RepID=UPI00404A2DAF